MASHSSSSNRPNNPCDTTTPPERPLSVYANGLQEARMWATGPPLDAVTNSAAARAAAASRDVALAAPTASQRLGALEAEVMEFAWHRGDWPGVNDVLAALQGERRGYTTVMTILIRLCDKGLLERRRRGRGFVYRPTLSKEELAARALREVLAAADYPQTVLTHFVKDLEGRRRVAGKTPGPGRGAGPDANEYKWRRWAVRLVVAAMVAGPIMLVLVSAWVAARLFDGRAPARMVATFHLLTLVGMAALPLVVLPCFAVVRPGDLATMASPSLFGSRRRPAMGWPSPTCCVSRGWACPTDGRAVIAGRSPARWPSGVGDRGSVPALAFGGDSDLGPAAWHGTPVDVLAFIDQANGAYHRLWVDHADLILHERMDAPGHFMDRDYANYNTPATITVPGR